MKKITKYISDLSKSREREKKYEELVKKEEEKQEELEEKIIQFLLNSGVQSINLVDVGTVFLSKSEYPSIEDVPKFYMYLRNKGEGSLIKETVHPATLRGWWNAMEEKPKAEDIGLGVYQKMKVSIRKN